MPIGCFEPTLRVRTGFAKDLVVLVKTVLQSTAISKHEDRLAVEETWFYLL